MKKISLMVLALLLFALPVCAMQFIVTPNPVNEGLVAGYKVYNAETKELVADMVGVNEYVVDAPTVTTCYYVTAYSRQGFESTPSVTACAEIPAEPLGIEITVKITIEVN